MNTPHEFIDAGFGVIPVYPADHDGTYAGGRKKCKTPPIKWATYQTERATHEQIDIWLEKYPGYAWGLVCGNVSGNLFVVDFDDAEVYEKQFSDTWGKQTLIVKTPSGGYHAYFRMDDCAGNIQEFKDFWDVDTRGNGGYVLAHTISEGYTIVNDMPIAKITEQELRDTFDIWKQFDGIGGYDFDRIKAEVTVPDVMRHYGDGDINQLSNIRTSSDYENMPCPHHSSKGGACLVVHKHFFKCFHCGRQGSVIDYVKERNGTSDIPMVVKAIEKYTNKKFRSDEVVAHVERVAKTGADFYTYTADGKVKGINKRVYADHLIQKHNFIVLVEKTTRQIFYYKNGIYHADPNGNFVIDQSVAEFGDLSNIVAGKEIVNQIIHTESCQIHDVLGIDVPKNLICVNNGILNYETMEFVPHTPEIIFTSKLATDYDPSAKGELISAMMERVFGDQADDEYEWLGFCLTPGYDIPYISFYHNTGKGGRSTYFNALHKFFGVHNVANESPHKIADDKNGTYKLLGKMANMCADIGETKIKKFETIRMITGNDPVPVEEKYIPSFTSWISAKMMWAANTLPIIADKTFATERRLRVIETQKKFTTEDKKSFNFNKTTSAKELSGLLNLAILGLKRLKARGDFVAGKLTIEEYTAKSHPVYNFMNECVKISGIEDDVVRPDELYEAFFEWCGENHVTIVMPRDAFINKFKDTSANRGVEFKSPRIGDVGKDGKKKKVRVFRRLHLL